MAKRKRDAREADLLLTASLRLKGWPPSRILEEVNRRVVAREAALLESQGYGPAQAAELAQEARIGPRSLRKDLTAIRRRLQNGVRAVGELLLARRIEEIELNLARLDLLEAEAWTAHEASGEAKQGRTEVLEAVELTESGQVKRSLRPKAVTVRSQAAESNASWLRVVLDCIARRHDLEAERFRLATCLSLSHQLTLAAEQGREEASAALRAELDAALATLTSAEGLAFPGMASPAVARLTRMQAPTRSPAGEDPAEACLTIEIVGLDVTDGS